MGPCKTNKKNNNKQSTSQSQKFNENIENNNMIRTYCVSGVYPNDVRNELISDSNDDVTNMPRNSDKLDSRYNVLKARINTVSYTHLDVYKRQVCRRVCAQEECQRSGSVQRGADDEGADCDR